MPSLVEGFREFVQREQLFQPEDKLLLAISGGVDSVVLASILAGEGYTFAMAHCNYQLRGEASDGDEILVRQLANGYAVPLHTHTTSLPHPLPQNFNLQIWARETRYKYFEKILDEYNYSILITAHHLDDNLETMLLNLLRGTGLAGLRAIPLSTPFPTARPLLFSGKSAIRDYADDRGLIWREDSSNTSLTYQRNRVRHRVVPVLRELGLTDGSLQKTFDHLRSAELFYEWGLTHHPAVVQGVKSVTIKLDVGELSTREIVTLLRFHASGFGFSDEEYRQMASATGYLELRSASHVARISPIDITLQPAGGAPIYTVTIETLPAIVQFGGATVQLTLVDRPESLVDSSSLFCRLPEMPLFLRPRAQGDRFRPLGMGGQQKKVKDFFIDLKLPSWQKETTPLLTDTTDRIVAIIPYRIDEAFAVGAKDARVLQIEYKKEAPSH
ncbi:MAG: tRNA lysidine(34) synthetase TilS [Lewinella sp.]